MKRFSDLNYHFGLKTRIYPDYSQLAIIKINSDKYRFWYNYQLGIDYYHIDIMDKYGYGNRIYNPLIQDWAYNLYEKRKPRYAKSIYRFMKNKKIDSLALNAAYQNRKRAWANFKNHLQRCPKYHSKKNMEHTWQYQTACLYHKNKNGYHVGSVKILDNYHVRLPKLGKIRTSKIRKLVMDKHDIRIGTVTISRDNTGQCYVSFQLGSDTPFVYLSKHSSKIAALGYDLNTSNFLMDTHGVEIPNPRYYERQEHKLKDVQRHLSRKYNHDKNHRLNTRHNYQRNRIKLAKIMKHVKNQRRNFLQVLSTELIENQDFLVGENLESRNMLRNHRIAKSIQSVGWRSFIEMLKYKALIYHKLYILINPAYTTQRCSNCGYICNKKDGTHLTLKDREWTCPVCHKHHIRDQNAAMNILQSGFKAIHKYISKTMRSSVRMATSGRKSGQYRQSRLLKYLMTHFYGVLDTSGRESAKLVHRD